MPKIYWLWLGLGVVAVVAIYQAFSAVKGAADKAADVIAAPIADALIPLIVGESVKVRGNVILPTGKKIPFDGLHIKGDLEFDNGGVRYRITKRRPDGDYDSVRVM